MVRATRVHATFAEYVPLNLLVINLVEIRERALSLCRLRIARIRR